MNGPRQHASFFKTPRKYFKWSHERARTGSTSILKRHCVKDGRNMLEGEISRWKLNIIQVISARGFPPVVGHPLYAQEGCVSKGRKEVYPLSAYVVSVLRHGAKDNAIRFVSEK